MPLSVRNGWGMQAANMAVTAVVAGANAVIGNVGVALSVLAGNAPIRLTKLSWRVDLAPDVAAGTASAPTRWRVLVVSGVLPQDVSIFQSQAFPSGAHPEIPAKTASGSPLPVYWDEWLDFAAGDPGLNQLVSETWSDAGPMVSAGETLSAILVPVLDANMDQSIIGAVSATMVIAVSGLAIPSGDLSSGGSGGSRSLPRYDVGMLHG